MVFNSELFIPNFVIQKKIEINNKNIDIHVKYIKSASTLELYSNACSDIKKCIDLLSPINDIFIIRHFNLPGLMMIQDGRVSLTRFVYN